MDVWTAPSSPPLFLEALTRLPANYSGTPVRAGRQRARLSVSPIHTLNLPSPHPPHLSVSPSVSPTPSPGNRANPAPPTERKPSLARSHPAMVFNSPAVDPDARTLFPATPDTGRLNGSGAMPAKVSALRVGEVKGTRIPRPMLNRNVGGSPAQESYPHTHPYRHSQSSSLNDVKQPVLFAPGQGLPGEAARHRRQSSVGRRPHAATLGSSLGRQVAHRRNDSGGRPRSMVNIFNTTVPPDPSPRFDEPSPFLDVAGRMLAARDDELEDEEEASGVDSPASATVSLPMPNSLSNSSIISLTNSTASLPPTTPSDLDPDSAEMVDSRHPDGSSSYFSKVLPLQTAFQPSSIAKKFKPPRDSGVAGLPPPSSDYLRPTPHASTSQDADAALITPGFTPHPSWPTHIAAALNLPPRAAPPTPAPPVMPDTPVKRPHAHFASIPQSQPSAFLGRLKNALGKEGPGSAPQNARQRKPTGARPSLPANMPSYASFSAGRPNVETSPEESPSVRSAARHSRIQHEPTGSWPRKTVPLEPRSGFMQVGHPRRELLKRTSSSASAFSDVSSSGDTVCSEDSTDVDMVTPTRGRGGRVLEGFGSNRNSLGAEALEARSSADTEFSPPDTSPCHQRSLKNLLAIQVHPPSRPFHPRTSLDPAVLRTPVSPHPASLEVPLRHPGGKGRHSYPEDNSSGRFERDFIEDGQLGRGGFGFAYKVKAKDPAEGEEGLIWAVKRRKTPFEGAKDRQRQLEETQIMEYLASAEVGGSHPNIVQMVDWWEQFNTLYIRTELCGLGDLGLLLQEVGRLSAEGLGEARVWKVLDDISKGLAHIHQAGVIHLDLKPANIFISEEGVLKIGDFGLATRWPRPAAALERGFEREGDREYMAPEILRGFYGKAADIYSLGTVILECVCNIVIPDMGEPWHKLRTDDFSDTELDVMASPDLAALIRAMMASSASFRPGIEEIMYHPVLQRLNALREIDAVRSAIEPEDESFMLQLLGHRPLYSPPEDAMDVDL